MFVHLIWFESRSEPERLVLPDQRLYDDYTTWLRESKAEKSGWYYEHEGGQLTVINFQKIATMTVRPQPASHVESPPPASAEHSLAAPEIKISG